MTFNVGEVGKRLVSNLNYDLSAKTALTLTITRPGGTTYERQGAISGSPYDATAAGQGVFLANRYVIYTAEADDLTEPGEYLVRIVYEDATPLVLVAKTSFTVSE